MSRWLRTSAFTLSLFAPLAGCSDAGSEPGGNASAGSGGNAGAAGSGNVAGTGGGSTSSGGTAGDATGGSGSESPAGTLSVALNVPSELQGTPRDLAITLYSELPAAGVPSAIAYQSGVGDDIAGTTLGFTMEAPDVQGEFYVYVVLYMIGGGQFAPVEGVDYDAASATKLTFDGSTPVTTGTLDLKLHEAGDGHF